MTRNRFRGAAFALALGLATVGATFTPVSAAAETEPEEAQATVRLMNHYVYAVRVYVFDAEGRRHALGRVEAGQFAELAIAGEFIDDGPLEVKAYPDEGTVGLAHGTFEENGIKTPPLELDGGDVVDFWLEPDLRNSMIRVGRG